MYLYLPTPSQTTKYWIYAFLIALVITLSVITRFRPAVLITILIFTVLVFLLLNSTTGVNYEGSLPEATYPPPPHLGLDGVSLQTRASY